MPTFQVREEECQVECSQVAGLTLPRPEEVEEVVTWCGLVLAGAGRQGGGGTAGVVRAGGLLGARSLASLVTGLPALLAASARTPWLAVSCRGEARTGASCSFVITRSGVWAGRLAQTVDYSSCKKSKYN